MHYVLSDIHGDQAAFDRILDMIGLSDADQLYILGDVVDRGSDGIALLEKIRKIGNCTLLLGNHEMMMINALRHPENMRYQGIWMNNGCDDTRRAYRHDFQTCRCGRVSVDGGHDYLRRCANSPDDYTDLSETEEADEKKTQAE